MYLMTKKITKLVTDLFTLMILTGIFSLIKLLSSVLKSSNYQSQKKEESLVSTSSIYDAK